MRNRSIGNRGCRFFYDVMIPEGYISKEDMGLLTVCQTVEEAVEAVSKFYKNYHSLRYVREFTVIRLEKPLNEAQISALNDQFQDIILDGKIDVTDPLPEEKMTRDQLRKPRLKFKFNKSNFGRLVELIHAINDFDL